MNTKIQQWHIASVNPAKSSQHADSLFWRGRKVFVPKTGLDSVFIRESCIKAHHVIICASSISVLVAARELGCEPFSLIEFSQMEEPAAANVGVKAARLHRVRALRTRLDMVLPAPVGFSMPTANHSYANISVPDLLKSAISQKKAPKRSEFGYYLATVDSYRMPPMIKNELYEDPLGYLRHGGSNERFVQSQVLCF